ncbi:hypothetical protein B0H11DRAFT_1257718 [Mycena galericulata]|nr:hypothetical protein B0H11DRAFT_1257718 [Mycena galericulata]
MKAGASFVLHLFSLIVPYHPAIKFNSTLFLPVPSFLAMGQALATANWFFVHLLYDQLFAKLRTTHADLTGRTFLITGANAGLGLALAIHLARLHPARLILGVRSSDKGEAAKREIVEQTGFAGRIDVWELDMELFASVVQFAKRAEAELERLDGAVLNAGVHAKEWEVTVDGWERVLQVNILSTGLLGVLLLPLLQATTRLPAPDPNASPMLPHLTITGSAAQFRAKFIAQTAPKILEALNDPTQVVHKERYETSKLFSLFLARAISGLRKAEGVVVNVAHPGLVVTDIGRDYKFGPAVKYVYCLLSPSLLVLVLDSALVENGFKTNL